MVLNLNTVLDQLQVCFEIWNFVCMYTDNDTYHSLYLNSEHMYIKTGTCTLIKYSFKIGTCTNLMYLRLLKYF